MYMECGHWTAYDSQIYAAYLPFITSMVVFRLYGVEFAKSLFVSPVKHRAFDTFAYCY